MFFLLFRFSVLKSGPVRFFARKWGNRDWDRS